MSWNVGHLLLATGIGHTVVGLILFHDAYAAILRDGFLDALYPHLDRLLAFWFMLFSPVCIVFGQVAMRAIERRDSDLLTLLGWHTLGLGVVGVLALPISGFWILIAIALLIFRTARSLGRSSAPFAAAGIRAG